MTSKVKEGRRCDKKFPVLKNVARKIKIKVKVNIFVNHDRIYFLSQVIL